MNRVQNMIEQVFVYGECVVHVYGTSENPWFRGNDVARILEYTRSRKAIEDHVPSKYKKTYAELFGENSSSNKNTLKTIFINMAGMYRLTMKSKKKEAIQFQDWVTDELLPSLKLTQINSSKEWKEYYQLTINIQTKQLQTLEKLCKQFTFYNKIFMPEYIYIVSTIENQKQNIFKIGRTNNLISRLQNYNTGRTEKEKMQLIYYVQVENSIVVEKHIHNALRRFSYQDTKEIFQADLEYLQNIINSFALPI